MRQPDSPAEVLVELLRQLVAELRSVPPAEVAIRPEDSLTDDLGLDSLSRMELFRRAERELAVVFPEAEAAAAATPGDLVALLQRARQDRAAPGAGPRWSPAQQTAGFPEEARTLLDVLDWHVAAHPDRLHLKLLDPAEPDRELTYAALREQSLRVAAGLSGLGLGPGERVGILLPTSVDYFLAFYGTLLAGGVPVPLYPPARLAGIEDHLRRQSGILVGAGVRVLLSFPEAAPVARALRTQVRCLDHIVTVPELLRAEPEPVRPALTSADLALLQYTSGSTGAPKGVALTHANLLANLRAVGRVIHPGPEDVFVSWLPLYHDMGLIGACLGTLYFGMPLVLMSPVTFLTRPARWLWALHRHHGTMSASPNFGYELCLARTDDAELEGLDLSSWRMALNGAEPVSAQTLARFDARFARHGFGTGVMTPVYGLAESSVALAFPLTIEAPAPVMRIRREAFDTAGRAEPADPDDATALAFVGCGRAIPGHALRIADDAGAELPPRQQGRLLFRGPSATAGYFENPEATARLRVGDWLDSGDLAYLDDDGELFPTGRIKDLVIRAGRNLHPQEIEQLVGEVDGVRTGCVAAFGSADPATGTERLVVVAETRQSGSAARQALAGRVRHALDEAIGVVPDEILVVAPKVIPKTSSGKLRRSETRALYEAGRLGRSVPRWRLMLGLLWGGLGGQLRALLALPARGLQAVRAWTAAGLTLAVVLPGLLLLRSRRSRWTLARSAARLGLRLAGIRIAVAGLERLPDGPAVVVANHSSNLDAFVLGAVLPGETVYLAKRELADRWLPRWGLSRLGVEFVERVDPRPEDVERYEGLASAGATLVVFPEGTFSLRPGVLPFRMGAFLVAAHTGRAIVPVAIRGTRAILRGPACYPRRGTAGVSVGEPLRPTSAEWAEAIRLRDASRAFILAHAGEPDLVASAQMPVFGRPPDDGASGPGSD